MSAKAGVASGLEEKPPSHMTIAVLPCVGKITPSVGGVEFSGWAVTPSFHHGPPHLS